MCLSTSLRRWRILDMNWTAEWQEGAGTPGLSGREGGVVWACVWSTCLSFTTLNNCCVSGWGLGLLWVLVGRRNTCCAAVVIPTSGWKWSYTTCETTPHRNSQTLTSFKCFNHSEGHLKNHSSGFICFSPLTTNYKCSSKLPRVLKAYHTSC